MLEVHSPVPLQEGESLVFGLSTKHLFHFCIGLVLSSPLILMSYFLLPYSGIPSMMSVAIGAGIGLIFAMIPHKNRLIAEVIWLTFRYALRPKLILYDRTYRTRERRNTAKDGDTI